MNAWKLQRINKIIEIIYNKKGKLPWCIRDKVDSHKTYRKQISETCYSLTLSYY